MGTELKRMDRASLSKRPVPRIALFVPSLNGGGAQQVIVTLANAFAERGLNTDLVLAMNQGPYRDRVAPEVRVIDLKAARTLTSLPALMRYLRSEQPNALLSTLMYANVVATFALRAARTDTRLVLREANSISRSHTRQKSLISRAIRLGAIWAYRSSDRVIGVSRGVADDLRNVLNLSKNKSVVIHNPAVRDEVLAQAENVTADNDVPTIISVGRLAEQKDFSTLLRAFAILRQTRKAQLIILGEGQKRDELEHLAFKLNLKDDVHMPGFVNDPYSYMTKASVFVLSSQWEGCPNVLIEAMACGTPVVSTDCPSGPAEILEDGRWGRLVPVGDVEAMAKAIDLTLDSPPPDGLVDRAMDFHVDRIAEEYLNVLLPDYFGDR